MEQMKSGSFAPQTQQQAPSQGGYAYPEQGSEGYGYPEQDSGDYYWPY
jgi:hypothetical protein